MKVSTAASVLVAGRVAALVAVVVGDRVGVDGSVAEEGGPGGKVPIGRGSLRGGVRVSVVRKAVGVGLTVVGGVVHAASSIKMNSNEVFFNTLDNPPVKM